VVRGRAGFQGLNGHGPPHGRSAVTVRAFETADAATVNRVALAAFAQYEAVYSDWDVLSRGVGSMSALADHAQIIVAEDDARLVGAVAYCPPNAIPRADLFEPEWPIIRMLVVDPAARNRGIGRKLMEECIRRARRDGAALIALHTSPAMQVALNMYLRMGFRPVKQVPDRFGVPYAVYTLDL
jgi:ribosomal protein S18 acetylase RimI-like enzyme